MVSFILSYKDIFLGTLTVDEISGKYAFEPDAAGVHIAQEETVLIREIKEGTKGFVPPIPFFQERILNMNRANLEEIRYHTDYFVLQKVKPKSRSCQN